MICTKIKRPIPQTGLKLIACITMLIDHLGYVFIHQRYGLYIALRVIGRLAFPIYCFLLTEAVCYTKSPWKYLLRLGILAILAEPCFDLMCYGRLTLAKQSVMVSCSWAQACVLSCKSCPNSG